MKLEGVIYAIFGITFLVMIAGIVFVVFLGTRVASEVNDNNGSVAKTMGTFYKDFEEASK